MSKLTGGALLLVLGIPLALYAALAVKAVARTDLVGGDPPADRGASKEQLAALRTRAGNWLAEVRKVGTVVGQYRAGTAADTSSEAAVKAAIEAASVRANDLLDADRFLSSIANPVFSGQKRDQFVKWHASRAKLPEEERAVRQWFEAPPRIDSVGTAKDAMTRARELIEQYRLCSPQFADGNKIAEWNTKARLYVVTALADSTNAQYKSTMERPLNTAASAATKDALTALRVQVKDLVDTAKGAGDALARELRAEAEAKAALIEESEAREELLGLFARDDLFTKPDGAAAWLKRVGDQYRRTRDARTRELIRDKVQQFCEAFVPAAVQLDESVLLDGKPVARTAVRIGYEPKAGADTKFADLSPAVDGLNELTLATKPPGANPYVSHNMSTYDIAKLKATDLSRAAEAYTAARAKVAAAPGRAKWNPNALAELKKACEDKAELVDKLKALDAKAAGQLWTRVSGLADGARGNQDLFSDQ